MWSCTSLQKCQMPDGMNFASTSSKNCQREENTVKIVEPWTPTNVHTWQHRTIVNNWKEDRTRSTTGRSHLPWSPRRAKSTCRNTGPAYRAWSYTRRTSAQRAWTRPALTFQISSNSIFEFRTLDFRFQNFQETSNFNISHITIWTNFRYKFLKIVALLRNLKTLQHINY